MAGLKRFPRYDEVYKDGVLDLSPYNLQALDNLVSVVVNKHFSLYNETEELRSIGMLKCIELLEGREFDPELYPHPSALKNFLYTGIRNEVGNYIYHNKNSKKEVLVDESTQNYSESVEVYEINPLFIKRYSKEYNLDVKEFTHYLYLKGFPVKSIPTPIVTREYDLDKHVIFFIRDYILNSV